MDAPTSNVFDCALVFEGGGYRGAFSAGISSVLLEQGIHFDYVCGLSAGASNAVNYVSRNQYRIREAFLARLGNERLGGILCMLEGKGYFNADYLYEGVIRDGTLPFDWETFAANPARVRIQAFERNTGKTVRFGREDMTSDIEVVNHVRASSTLPGVMKELPLDGKVFLDGGLGTGAGIPLCMAEDEGFEKFFFVATRPKGYRKQEPTARDLRLYKRLAKDYPYLRNALITRWKRYNDALEHVEDLAREGKALIVYPEHMNVESGTLDQRKLLDCYEHAREQARRELPTWREFLFGAPDAGPKPAPDTDGYITLG